MPSGRIKRPWGTSSEPAKAEMRLHGTGESWPPGGSTSDTAPLPLFVWPDGHLDHMPVPRAHLTRGRISRAVRRPYTVTIDWAPAKIEYQKVDFAWCGHLFDGTPVFAADGWQFIESYVDGGYGLEVSTQRLLCETHMVRNLERLLRTRYPRAIELDRRIEPIVDPANDDKCWQDLRLRILAVVPV